MSKILFIVEGESTEEQILQNLVNGYMNTSNFDGLNIEEMILPTGTNIYTVYKKIKEDPFPEDVDIISIIQELILGKLSKRGLKKSKDKKLYNKIKEYKRDTFSEVYMFFDYDKQANDTNEHDKIIEDMLNMFDNETEMGKLFISYPMVEAIKDFSEKICDDYTRCKICINEFSNYKNISSNRTVKNDFKKYNKETWNFIIQNFIFKVNCLFDIVGNKDYQYYSKNINTYKIFKKQSCMFKKDNTVMILSAIPEFIIYYLGEIVFNKSIIDDEFNKIEKCKK